MVQQSDKSNKKASPTVSVLVELNGSDMEEKGRYLVVQRAGQSGSPAMHNIFESTADHDHAKSWSLHLISAKS